MVKELYVLAAAIILAACSTKSPQKQTAQSVTTTPAATSSPHVRKPLQRSEDVKINAGEVTFTINGGILNDADRGITNYMKSSQEVRLILQAPDEPFSKAPKKYVPTHNRDGQERNAEDYLRIAGTDLLKSKGTKRKSLLIQVDNTRADKPYNETQALSFECRAVDTNGRYIKGNLSQSYSDFFCLRMNIIYPEPPKPKRIASKQKRQYH